MHIRREMNSFFILERIIDELLKSIFRLEELYLSLSLFKIKFHISKVFFSLIIIVFVLELSEVILFSV